MTRHFSTLCSFVAGLVLLVSGFLKLIDPIGTGFIMEEYFKFLGLGFMVPASVAAGIAVSVVEFLTGGLMMFRFRMRITTVVALIMMGFYLILTLFLAIFNPPIPGTGSGGWPISWPCLCRWRRYCLHIH